MSMIASLSVPSPANGPINGPTGSGQTELREDLGKAAKAFETIFIRQMLATARKSSEGQEGGLFSSQAMQQFRTMQDENFAEIAGTNGGFGLADAIERHLSQQMGLSASHKSSPRSAVPPMRIGETEGASALKAVPSSGPSSGPISGPSSGSISGPNTNPTIAPTTASTTASTTAPTTGPTSNNNSLQESVS